MAKISDEEKKIVLSSLLHDIGKLTYLTDEKRVNHSLSGAAFVSNIMESLNGIDAIKQNIQAHHNPRSDHPLVKLLKKADGISADEREKYNKEDDAEIEKNRDKVCMEPVFMDISLGDPHHNLKKKIIEMAHINQLEITDHHSSSVIEDYKRIRKELESDIKKILHIKDFRKFVDTLNYVLMKNLRTVPSATYYDKPDISLYDHLKTTAAIALCLFRTEEERKRERFLLIGGDVSGIQDFIFSNFRQSASDKNSAKRLRGRSTFINLLVDAVSAYIKEELGLYEFNILWASGGNFVMLAPNTKDNTAKLENIRKNVNKHLFDNYGNLYVNISWVPGDEDDVKNFPVFLDKLRDKESIDKQRKWYFMLSHIYSKRKPSTTKEEKICSVCGMREGEKIGERRVCDVCRNLEELGEEMVKSRYLGRVYGQHPSCIIRFSFGDFYVTYGFDIVDTDFIYSKNSFDIPERFQEMNPKSAWGFKVIGDYVPNINNVKVLSFDHIVDASFKELDKRKSPENGKPSKLAIFKADVDNLGLIFSMGLPHEKRSISRITQLSFLFDYFFSIKVNDIAKKHNIYVLFSGGDDLTVAGRYDEVLEFSKSLQKEFTNWVCNNPDITISAGIEMSGYKFPVSRLVEHAENSLKKSKENENSLKKSKKSENSVCNDDIRKNRVTLFGITVEWSLFHKLYELYNEMFKKHLEDEKISSGLLYTLLKIYELHHMDNLSYRIIHPDPYIWYFVSRNWKAKTDEAKKSRKEFVDALTNEEIFNKIKIPISLTSLYNRYFKDVNKKEVN